MMAHLDAEEVDGSKTNRKVRVFISDYNHHHRKGIPFVYLSDPALTGSL